MKYREIMRVMSVKHASDVLFEINNSCKIEEYLSFKELVGRLKLNKNTLRRITNRLSRARLIKSVKANTADKRERVYVVCDAKLTEMLLDLLAYLHK